MRRSSREVPVELVDRAVALYLEGYSAQTISRMLDRKIGETTIYLTLRRCGISRRHKTTKGKRWREQRQG